LNSKKVAFNKPITIAQVLQCKKSKSSNQNTIQAHYTLQPNNVNVKCVHSASNNS